MGGPGSGPKPNLERYQEVFEAVKSGKTMREVAAEFGITRQRVQQMVSRIDPTFVQRQRSAKREEEQTSILTLWQKGYSRAFIAQMLGLNILTVNMRLRQLGIKLDDEREHVRDKAKVEATKEKNRKILLEELRSCYVDLQEPLSWANFDSWCGKRRSQYVRLHFDSFADACDKAGVPCTDKTRVYSEKTRADKLDLEDCLAAVRQYLREEEWPTCVGFEKWTLKKGLPMFGRYRTKYTWLGLVEMAKAQQLEDTSH